MHVEIVCTFLLTFFLVVHAQMSEANKNEESDARIFLSTFTVILSTVTSTTTIGTTTTCTTSSSAMAACSVGGRRRRGILLHEEDKQASARKGLFYNEDESELNDGSISMPVIQVKRSVETSEGTTSSSLITVDNTNLIPLTIQSGFSLPGEFSNGTPRFKLAYGTSTVITTATSTATRSLFIFCNSITNYGTCSGSG